MIQKKKVTPAFFNQQNHEVVLHYQAGSEIEKQIAMTGLTKKDFQYNRTLQPFVKEPIQALRCPIRQWKRQNKGKEKCMIRFLIW